MSSQTMFRFRLEVVIATDQIHGITLILLTRSIQEDRSIL